MTRSLTTEEKTRLNYGLPEGSRRFLITVVPIARESRRRCGKSTVQTFDVHDPQRELLPVGVERAYERTWDDAHPGSHTTVKVIDVREVRS